MASMTSVVLVNFGSRIDSLMTSLDIVKMKGILFLKSEDDITVSQLPNMARRIYVGWTDKNESATGTQVYFLCETAGSKYS